MASVAQVLSDGSISLADFRALLPKEDRFVELSTHCIQVLAPASGTGTVGSTWPTDARNEHLRRSRASFAHCRSRLQRYELHRKRVEFFVERFRIFSVVGIAQLSTRIVLSKSTDNSNPQFEIYVQ